MSPGLRRVLKIARRVAPKALADELWLVLDHEHQGECPCPLHDYNAENNAYDLAWLRRNPGGMEELQARNRARTGR